MSSHTFSYLTRISLCSNASTVASMSAEKKITEYGLRMIWVRQGRVSQSSPEDVVDVPGFVEGHAGLRGVGDGDDAVVAPAKHGADHARNPARLTDFQL